MRNLRMRRTWLAVHLYLGLLLGGFFVLLSITGSLLVFYLEIDQLLTRFENVMQPSNRAIVSEADHHQHIQPIADQLSLKFPDRKLGWRIEFPLKNGDPFMARYMQPIETQGRHFAPMVVFIDAQTHDIISTRFWGQFFVTWLYDLHYTLLLEGIGKTFVAVLGIFLMLSIFSGIYVWWPKNGHFKSALRVRKNSHNIRKIYDIHKLSGLIGCLFLLMLAITGVMLQKPEWFKSALSQPAALYEVPKLQSTLGKKPISLDQVKAICLQRFPKAELRWIYTPKDPTDIFQARLFQKSEPSRRFPKTIVFLDQYTGEILATRDAQQDLTGDVILQWLHPLHNGEAFGSAGRWLVFFTGGIPIILFVTGLMRWRQKKRSSNILKNLRETF